MIYIYRKKRVILNQSKDLTQSMESIKIYQIGLGSYGKHGFEKLIDMHQHMEKVDIELAGVCDIHPEKLEIAKKYSKTHDIDIKRFQDVDKMYSAARKNKEEDEKVLIYDAGPSETHAEHIYKSINQNFFHLAERPPSMKRDAHIHEKKLAKDKPIFWKVDFIERESPVVKKTLDLLSEAEEIEEINVFRESTVGVQKMINPVERAGVQGGDILDKMTHEIFVLDFLEEVGQRPNFKLEQAECKYFLPFKQGSDSFMNLKGSKNNSINHQTATAMTKASFDTGKTRVNLHSSWIGVSSEAKEVASEIGMKEELLNGEVKKENDHLFSEEEARFYTIKGSQNLLGDLLNGKLYDLDTGKELETPDIFHDQLYRVLEKAILQAAGEKDSDLTEEEIDLFMNSIFNIKDEIHNKDHDFYEELSKAKKKVEEKVMGFEDFVEDEVET